MDINQKSFTNKGLYHKFQTKNYDKKLKDIPPKCQGLKDFVDLCLEVKYFDTKCENKIIQFDECLKNHQSTNQS